MLQLKARYTIQGKFLFARVTAEPGSKSYIFTNTRALSNPSSTTAASSLRKLGRHDEATAALVRAAAADPCDARVQYKLGQHLRSTGDCASAIEAYARALDLDPGHALAAFWLPATKRLNGEGYVDNIIHE